MGGLCAAHVPARAGQRHKRAKSDWSTFGAALRRPELASHKRATCVRNFFRRASPPALGRDLLGPARCSRSTSSRVIIRPFACASAPSRAALRAAPSDLPIAVPPISSTSTPAFFSVAFGPGIGVPGVYASLAASARGSRSTCASRSFSAWRRGSMAGSGWRSVASNIASSVSSSTGSASAERGRTAPATLQRMAKMAPAVTRPVVMATIVVSSAAVG